MKVIRVDTYIVSCKVCDHPLKFFKFIYIESNWCIMMCAIEVYRCGLDIFVYYNMMTV